MAQIITTVRTVKDLRTQLAKWREAGLTIALVPTMGALHAGHLSLIAIARSNADRVVASIFVNPAQFGPREDLAHYPRDEAGDVQKLAETGADLVFIPDVAEMYPPGFATRVSLPSLTDDLCGAARPNHFEGVATVVTKLLLQSAPDVAVFGEKDYQQLLMIKRLVRDLDIPVRIVAGPVIREADGFALSSRNAYLAPPERKAAPHLFQTLSTVAEGLAEGRGCDDAAESGRFKLEALGFRVDYVEIRDPETLAPLLGPIRGPARVLGAVYLGKTRLIDNVPTVLKSR
jgi:pantoate--beta-alanine ligase